MAQRTRFVGARSAAVAAGLLVVAAVSSGTRATGCAPDSNGVVDVVACGATPTNQLDDDSAAIQAANDAVSANGGTVFFPAGTYHAQGVVQDSNVTFLGNSKTTSIVKHRNPHPIPASYVPPVIQGRQWHRVSGTLTGTIAANSNTLQVSDLAQIDVGDLVAVRGAGGPDPNQRATLSLAAVPLSTSLTVSEPVSGFASSNPEDRYLVVGSEIVHYGSITQTTKTFNLSGPRGRFGTTVPAQHPVGTQVSQALRLTAEVVSIDTPTKTLTLDRSAVIGVTGAHLTVGSTNMSIRGLTIDGGGTVNLNQPGDPIPLYYALAGDVDVRDLIIQNADNKGLVFTSGTHDSTVENVYFINNGIESPQGTGHVWLYQGTVDNDVINNWMSGVTRFAVMVDDRTNQSSEFDAPNDRNTISGNTISVTGDAQTNVGIGLYGGSFNTISDNAITGVDFAEGDLGMLVGFYQPQGQPPRSSYNNTVENNSVTGQSTAIPVGILVNGESNTFTGNSFLNVTTRCGEFAGAANNTYNGSPSPTAC